MTSYEKFCRNKLSRWTTSKRFPGNKKSRNSKFVRRNIRFYCTVIKVGHLTCVKIVKKEFQKTCFPLFFLSWVLNFWNFTNATIIWYHNYKSIFFSEYSQMTTFLENFAGRNFCGWRLLKNFAGINFRGEPLLKDFPGIKKAEILNLWEETFVFIVLWLRWDTWPVLKSLKKSFKKLVFHYSSFLEFLIFEILRMPQ